jgi:hypothetical protein
MTIGLLAAIPFMAQVVRLPTIFWWKNKEAQKNRRYGIDRRPCNDAAAGVSAFFASSSLQGPLLLSAQLAITVPGSLGSCAINSWFHQLLPTSGLGEFFGRRFLIGLAAPSHAARCSQAC